MCLRLFSLALLASSQKLALLLAGVWGFHVPDSLEPACIMACWWQAHPTYTWRRIRRYAGGTDLLALAASLDCPPALLLRRLLEAPPARHPSRGAPLLAPGCLRRLVSPIAWCRAQLVSP